MTLKPRETEFLQLTRELLDSDQVRMMGRWRHHGPVTTLDHSLFVAYNAYRAARLLRLDVRAAARNAAGLTDLSDKERNIILSHMWPLGGAFPRSWEAWLVDLVDTVCAALELTRIYRPSRLRERLGVRPLAPLPA